MYNACSMFNAMWPVEAYGNEHVVVVVIICRHGYILEHTEIIMFDRIESSSKTRCAETVSLDTDISGLYII